MASYNSAALLGRLTKEPEIRSTGSGKKACMFTLAVDRQMSKAQRDQAEQAGQQTADFISCVAWEREAEFLQNYAAKGTLLLVSGRIQTRTYEKSDGSRIYVTEVNARDIQMLTSKATSESTGASKRYDYGSSHGTDKAPDQIDRGNQMPDLTGDLPF